MKRKKGRTYRSRLNFHHIFPSSRVRGGKVVLLPVNFHSAWHIVFGNLYGLECHNFLRALLAAMEANEVLNNNKLEQIREDSKCYRPFVSIIELKKNKDSVYVKK